MVRSDGKLCATGCTYLAAKPANGPLLAVRMCTNGVWCNAGMMCGGGPRCNVADTAAWRNSVNKRVVLGRATWYSCYDVHGLQSVSLCVALSRECVAMQSRPPPLARASLHRNAASANTCGGSGAMTNDPHPKNASWLHAQLRSVYLRTI